MANTEWNAKEGYPHDYKGSFLIQINEAQRAFITAALEAFQSGSEDLLVDDDGNIRDELNMLHGMFDDLPNQLNTFTKEDGRRELMLHGLCL